MKKSDKDIIYLDNANVTKVDDNVLKILEEYYINKFGVPGGEFGHRYEEEAADSIWKARETIAKKINAQPEEIIFTTGVTEGNNLAIKGAVNYFAHRKGKVKIVTDKIERRCVLNTFRYLHSLGHRTIFIDVDKNGFIKMDELEKEMKNAFLVSIQHANQEIGVIQDIKAVGEIAENKNVIFHTDATHSFLKEKIDVEKIPVDMITMSGHVIHAPLGSGALFVREGIKLVPLFHGAIREFGFRAGYPNLPAIMGFAMATKLMKRQHTKKMKEMRDYLIKNLLLIKDSKLNGGMHRICDNLNISFGGIEGEAILMMANEMGLILRTGSACYNPKLEPSYVIRAIGGSIEDANSSVRITLSRLNTMDEMKKTVEIINEIVEKLRAISPIYRGRK